MPFCAATRPSSTSIIPPIAASMMKSWSCEVILPMPACSPVALLFPRMLRLADLLLFCDLFAFELLLLLFWLEFCSWPPIPAFSVIAQHPPARMAAKAQTCADLINCLLLILPLLVIGGTPPPLEFQTSNPQSYDHGLAGPSTSRGTFRSLQLPTCYRR